MSSKPKLLVIDIETAPAELYGWGLYNQNFGLEQIKKHPYILCVAYKWVGEKTTTIASEWGTGHKEMLTHVHGVLSECDAVVSKNGVKFDLPWLLTEFAKYKLPPLPLLTHIDLDKVAKKQFRFFSNKLDYILQYLDIGKKVEHEGFGLWKKVLEGDKSARERMLRYCIGDVRMTEKLYLRLRPYIADHPSMRAIGTEACQACGSHNTERRGFRYTKCFKIQRHQCKNCGAWFSGTRKKVA